jgi:hypothetical protein
MKARIGRALHGKRLISNATPLHHRREAGGEEMVLRCAFAAALLVPALVGCGYHAEMPGPAGIP